MFELNLEKKKGSVQADLQLARLQYENELGGKGGQTSSPTKRVDKNNMPLQVLCTLFKKGK